MSDLYPGVRKQGFTEIVTWAQKLSEKWTKSPAWESGGLGFSLSLQGSCWAPWGFGKVTCSLWTLASSKIEGSSGCSFLLKSFIASDIHLFGHTQTRQKENNTSAIPCHRSFQLHIIFSNKQGASTRKAPLVMHYRCQAVMETLRPSTYPLFLHSRFYSFYIQSNYMCAVCACEGESEKQKMFLPFRTF